MKIVLFRLNSPGVFDRAHAEDCKAIEGTLSKIWIFIHRVPFHSTWCCHRSSCYGFGSI